MDNSYYNSLTAGAKADDSQIIAADNCRITVITPYLIRAEKQNGHIFCDEPTQTVLCRSFEKPSFTYERVNGILIIKTEKTVFHYDTARSRLILAELSDGRRITDFSKGNLGGTCRTLDNTSGKWKLDSITAQVQMTDGVCSTEGVAVLDDSGSLIIGQDGNIVPRAAVGKDEYYFAYGFDYIKAVQDLFCLTGRPELIPRFALGNWWSRYKAYTQEEYETLIARFEAEKIPLTVATIDMDWHWTDVVKRFGNEAKDQYMKASARESLYTVGMPGWGGYSWNTELFPDPKGFLRGLKEKNLKVTMNLHPHSGCRFFEDAYPDFAEFMGIDKDSKQQIFFDITDEKFREGYFKYLHHPHEKDGVDFWWIDWQQGMKTYTPGLDPLWALNHYHTIDNAREGRRGLILSRFAGAGSQRYPLGFSGDTFQTWKALDFQPEFTAKASNIGYTWWSHDIGGHCFGKRDDELYLRWVQFGIFSPINRLHSTANEFMGKEPWKYRSSVRVNATEALRLRHRMIPYIYTMNRRTWAEGRALMEPMYYGNPRDSRAYTCGNEYRFGSELIVAPITKPMDNTTELAGTRVYLPKGRYTDIFTGRIYDGNRIIGMFRDEASIPVLAKEGAIIPLDRNDTENDCSNPKRLDIWAYRGNGSFTLYEDDGETTQFKNGVYCETAFEINENGNDVSFVIGAVSGDKTVLPESREIRVIFKDITGFESAALYKNGKKLKDCHTQVINGETVLTLRAYEYDAEYMVKLSGVSALTNPPKKEMLIDLISRIQTNNNKKLVKYTDFVLKGKKIKLPKELQGPVDEITEMK